MNSFICYLKNPFYCESRKPSIYTFIALIFFYLLASISIGIVSFIVCKAFHLVHNKQEWSPLKTILIGILLAPFYEEVLFRSLLRFKWSSIHIFVPTAIAFVALSIYKSKFILPILLSLFVLGLFLFVTIVSRIKIESFITSKFKYFFYSSSIIFGLLHASNFTGNIYLILTFSFILGGPQIVLGLILGYIRMNHGLKYSILFHLVVNMSLILTII
jgi:membrane protease YdiL (CAAX protease family)